jgi:hypothetical protein
MPPQNFQLVDACIALFPAPRDASANSTRATAGIIAIEVATERFILVDNAPKANKGTYRCCDEKCRADVFVKRNYEMGATKGPNNNGSQTFHVMRRISIFNTIFKLPAPTTLLVNTDDT